jgi:hypothetical protein
MYSLLSEVEPVYVFVVSDSNMYSSVKDFIETYPAHLVLLDPRTVRSRIIFVEPSTQGLTFYFFFFFLAYEDCSYLINKSKYGTK